MRRCDGGVYADPCDAVLDATAEATVTKPVVGGGAMGAF